MKQAVIYLIKVYKKLISPFLPHSCRFYPTCSSYTITAIEKYGLLKGGGMGLLRVLKCNPFHPGGYDPVK
ncbi:MAG: membrane protein insertion efficiency factor YidD [Candidatus Cloacimonas sp. 4484_209]|nr:MAG: membrane protein insertion efficiency factor YidD [Candidatus Cloacimonas sp. 4484_209]